MKKPLRNGIFYFKLKIKNVSQRFLLKSLKKRCETFFFDKLIIKNVSQRFLNFGFGSDRINPNWIQTESNQVCFGFGSDRIHFFLIRIRIGSNPFFFDPNSDRIRFISNPIWFDPFGTLHIIICTMFYFIEIEKKSLN